VVEPTVRGQPLRVGHHDQAETLRDRAVERLFGAASCWRLGDASRMFEAVDRDNGTPEDTKRKSKENEL
jgi:hypothetical protein